MDTSKVDPHLDDAAVWSFVMVLAEVETGNTDVPGDGGTAIGPLQIHYPYWKDATIGVHDLGYNNCHDYGYAACVTVRYWKRYCPIALKEHNWEVLARTHNGGPSGSTRDSTLHYWGKVQTKMQEMEFQG